MKDYYAILGIDRGATQDEVQKAFRTLAHKYHPDKKDGDVEKFKEVNEAYQVLGDEQKRQQYDSGGFMGNGQQYADGFDFSNVHVNFGGGGFNDIFDAVRNAFTNTAFRGEDVTISIELSFDEAILGVTKNITIPYRRKAAETVAVQFQPGMYSGAEVVLRGRGEPARDGRFEPGNLHIQIRVKEHETLHRKGRDILCDCSLTMTEALLGVTKEVDWVGGKTFAVTVPERTSHGDMIAVKTVALPSSDLLGSVFVVCLVQPPKKRMSKKVRELLEALQSEGW